MSPTAFEHVVHHTNANHLSVMIDKEHASMKDENLAAGALLALLSSPCRNRESSERAQKRLKTNPLCTSTSVEQLPLHLSGQCIERARPEIQQIVNDVMSAADKPDSSKLAEAEVWLFRQVGKGISIP